MSPLRITVHLQDNVLVSGNTMPDSLHHISDSFPASTPKRKGQVSLSSKPPVFAQEHQHHPFPNTNPPSTSAPGNRKSTGLRNKGERLTRLTNCENVASTAVIDLLYREWDSALIKTKHGTSPRFVRGMKRISNHCTSTGQCPIISEHIPDSLHHISDSFPTSTRKERDKFLSHQNPSVCMEHQHHPFRIPIPFHFRSSAAVIDPLYREWDRDTGSALIKTKHGTSLRFVRGEENFGLCKLAQTEKQVAFFLRFDSKRSKKIFVW
ncbi:hypothetical protein CEXT_244721 [Caerostris extrusa]|uniref:Uncharacterized protein n=1 Tax=Caerostris extrusa TaxID=172846 RepID=A0AAV4QKF8_CAEEX|nr:hypothetical protein CEXT_244721 [Caerostris extrusa]